MRGGFGASPPLGIQEKNLLEGFFRRGSMFGAVNPPRRARGERRLGLIKRSVREIKLKISHKIRGRGCSCCQARGRALPLLRSPPPVPRARLPPAVPAHVPRCRAKEHPGRCRQPVPRRGKRGGHAGEKGSTCSPSKPRGALGGLEVSGARCTLGGLGCGGAKESGGGTRLWQGCPKSPAKFPLG